ncbi:hypothetical protein L7F22_038295 [Adiantum nelumboides]|nr:hypothetical protein [Adiantum nelumboides]
MYDNKEKVRVITVMWQVYFVVKSAGPMELFENLCLHHIEQGLPNMPNSSVYGTYLNMTSGLEFVQAITDVLWVFFCKEVQASSCQAVGFSPEFMHLDKLCRSIYSWLHVSGKRFDDFKLIEGALDLPDLAMLQIHLLRWLSRGQVLERMVKVMPALFIEFGKEKPKLNVLNCQFQSDIVDIANILGYAEATLQNLEKKFLRDSKSCGTKYLQKFVEDSRSGEMKFFDAGGDLHIQELKFNQIKGSNRGGTFEDCMQLGGELVENLHARMEQDIQIFDACKLFNPKHYPNKELELDSCSKAWLQKILSQYGTLVSDVEQCMGELDTFTMVLASNFKHKIFCDAWDVWFVMAKKDSSSKKRHEVIDGVTSDFVHQWYVDVYDIEGNRAENFLLFTSKNESSKFEQVGAIEDIMDGCAGKEGVPCNVIKIKGKNVSYKLDPLSFDSSHVREDEEYSLKKMGWVLCEEIKGTEDIVIAYKAIKNSEALLSSKNDERVKNRQRTQAPQPKSMVEDISQEESPTPSNLATRPSTLEENPLSKALVVSDPNMLREDAPSFDNIEPTNAQSTISLEVKGVEMTFDFPGVCEKKGKNEELGFHMFEKLFPFGPTTQFAIPVVKCEEAPPLYTYRTLAWDYVETLTNLFVNNPMAPAIAAYLMPFVKENGKARPMQCEEVDRHKLETYDYWIIFGLHSIHAAKIYIQSTTPRCLATKHLYATRNARILVDCQAEMCIELSRMTNKESHNVMKNAPYLEQLKQLRDQWRAFGSPSKPQQGLPKTSLQQIPWKRFSDYIGDKWASRDYHMIVSSKDIFDGWVTIMKKYAKGELLSQAQSSRKKGRQPSPATFRCLMGLKDGEVATLQQEINEGSILFLKNKWDSEDVIDMETRAKQIKQDRVLKEELVSLFNASIANTNGALKTWEELVIDFDITEDAYSKILGVCSDWVQKKLTRGADAGPLPNGAKDIVTFFLRKKENPHESSSTLPWRVYVVGCNLEALELIHNVYKDPITIGVVVLDAEHGVEGMKWDSFKFGRLVSSLLKMTCDPKQFVLLSFLTRRQMATFEDALEGMKCKYTMLVGSVDFLPASNHFALGAIDTFVVLTLINMEKHFINLDRYVNNVNKPCILDNTIVDEGEKGKGLEEDQQLARAILKKKKHVINTTINAFNDEHEVVLDVFACGLASKVALLNHKKTIAVVCNTQEQRDVEAIC